MKLFGWGTDPSKDVLTEVADRLQTHFGYSCKVRCLTTTDGLTKHRHAWLPVAHEFTVKWE